MTKPYTERRAVHLTLITTVLVLFAGAATAQSPARETRGNLVLEGIPPHSTRAIETLDGWLA